MQVTYAPDAPLLFWLRGDPKTPPIWALCQDIMVHWGSGISLVYLWKPLQLSNTLDWRKFLITKFNWFLEVGGNRSTRRSPTKDSYGSTEPTKLNAHITTGSCIGEGKSFPRVVLSTKVYLGTCRWNGSQNHPPGIKMTPYLVQKLV